MKVIDLINSSKSTAFSFEILPPLKGNSIQKVYNVIDKLIEFDPKYINITSHHSEYIYKTLPDGSFQKVNIRKRPGSVAIASAIQNKYGITAVPHIICKGFTKDETEYALIDLNFLGVYDLLLLRGDVKTLEAGQKTDIYHEHATDLQRQVNDFNKGIAIDGSAFEANETPFSYGMACYPEKHEEAPNMESDIFYLKEKVKNGADYLVTQMFFDNNIYYRFLYKALAKGIDVPVTAGIMPVTNAAQVKRTISLTGNLVPAKFLSIVDRFGDNPAAMKQAGIAYATEQIIDLIANGVNHIHIYSMNKPDVAAAIMNNLSQIYVREQA